MCAPLGKGGAELGGIQRRFRATSHRRAGAVAHAPRGPRTAPPVFRCHRGHRSSAPRVTMRCRLPAPSVRSPPTARVVRCGSLCPTNSVTLPSPNSSNLSTCSPPRIERTAAPAPCAATMPPNESTSSSMTRRQLRPPPTTTSAMTICRSDRQRRRGHPARPATPFHSSPRTGRRQMSGILADRELRSQRGILRRPDRAIPTYQTTGTYTSFGSLLPLARTPALTARVSARIGPAQPCADETQVRTVDVYSASSPPSSTSLSMCPRKRGNSNPRLASRRRTGP